MPEHVPRDQAATRAALARWLGHQLGVAGGIDVGEMGGPQSTGFSNETLIFDATWEGQCHGFVVRPQPTGHTVFLDPAFEAQYRVLEILGTKTDVAVPRVRWYEPDPAVLGAPFFVMDRVDGRAPEDTPPYHAAGWVHGLRPEERARLWWNGLDQLARIHRIDPVALGLTFLDHPERGRPGLDQQLHYYDDYFDWVAGGRPHPTVTDARRWLEDHRPADEPVGLVWGDSRLGNVLFGENVDVVAVVDWEMVTLGNPVEDLAWWLFLDRHHSVGVERLPGFPSPEETVAWWEQATGRSAAHLAYYEVFAAYRFSVIMLRVIDLAIELGYMPSDATHGIDNTCSQLLAGLLGLPAPSTR